MHSTRYRARRSGRDLRRWGEMPDASGDAVSAASGYGDLCGDPSATRLLYVTSWECDEAAIGGMAP